jgi:hypothetical protein
MKLNPTNKCLWCDLPTDGNLYCNNNCGALYRVAHGATRKMLKPGRCNNPECGEKCEGTFCNRRCRGRYETIQRRERTFAAILGTVKEAEPEPEPEQIELIPARKITRCTCGNFRKCIRCRNAERRRAFREGDVPAYVRQIMTAAATD